MAKFLLIPDGDIYAMENATNLFFKLSNNNVDITIDTNIFIEFNERIKYYNFNDYYTIIVDENSYYYLNESNRKVITIDEIMNLTL